MPRVLLVVVVFVVAVVALIASFALGPQSSMPDVVRIDESYLEAVSRQYLLAGALTSLATVLVAETLKVSLKIAAAILIVCGTIAPVLSALSEPSFPSGVGGAMVEFLLPYGTVCAVTLVVVRGARLLVNRRASVGGMR